MSYPWKEKWKLALFGLVFGNTKLGAVTRFFQTFRGEDDTWSQHTFNVLRDGTTIVESNPGGTKKATWMKYDKPEYYALLIGVKGILEHQRSDFDVWSQSMVGKKYAYTSVAKQFGDGILSKLIGRDIRFFRKFHLFKNKMFYNICSWLTSFGLKKIGVPFFGWVNYTVRECRGPRIRIKREWKWVKLDPRTINPDEIWDNVFRTWEPPPPEDWTPPVEFFVVEEIGKRPKNLTAGVILKIKEDCLQD